MCNLVIAALLFGVGATAGVAQEPKRAAALKLSWDKNILSIAGPKVPGGDIKILYLEAYCRPGSTDRDWRETVIGHKTELLDADRDGRSLKLRCTLNDGVVVDHNITATGDEVDFRLTAHNPTKKTSQAHWAQPCVRVDRFTGRGQKDYLPKCFVFQDGKPARMPFEPWAIKARYVPGQVWCPKNVDRNDVNPRPLSEIVPSNGLIGCYSADEKSILAMAWEPYQELFQGVIVCVHSDFRIGGLKPGETKKIRGKLYIVPAQMEELRKRYEKDFPEHARIAGATDPHAPKPPYDVFPPAEPPYYRVRYAASDKKGELPYAVNYTIWIPPGVKTLRGVVVHQHGCGEGSCKSGLTGAYDLHWQALAKKHDCALLSPSYEQPEKADCQMWCDPRNGSDAAFQKCLADLGMKSGHPELATVPWALWGHSGGGHWAGGMVMLHPDRVAAAWLRSGVPLLKADSRRATIKAHTLPDAALQVPMMCNLGTKEGVTVKDKNFGGVWPANEVFFNAVRGRGGRVGVAIDPLTSHECGNQRYLAIPWLDACLTARLPKTANDPLRPMPTDEAWLVPVLGNEAAPAAKFAGEPLKAGWLPNEAIAKAWMEYVKDTRVTDHTPPPSPTNVHMKGNTLTWKCEADLESGLASFVIERDGQVLATVPKQGKNPFGRPIFQNLQYSDTPTQPLVPMQFTDATADANKTHTYRVIAVNTAGLKSKPSAAAKP